MPLPLPSLPLPAFSQRASVSTYPTPKGVQAINPFSPLFGLHLLDHKPLKSFYEGKDRTLLLRLIEAEKNGLLTLTINPPSVPDSTAPGGWNLDPNPLLNGAGLAKLVLPPAYRTEEEGNPVAFQSWSLLRIRLLEVLISFTLYPSLAEECRRDLIRLGKETVVEEAALNFEAMLKVGPYRQPAMNSRQVRVHAHRPLPLGRSLISRTLSVHA